MPIAVLWVLLGCYVLGLTRSGQQATVWLDSALGGLGAATGLAVLLGPVLATGPGSLLATGVAVTYPLTDELLGTGHRACDRRAHPLTRAAAGP